MGQLVVYFYLYNYQIDQIPLSWVIVIFMCIIISIINVLLPMDVINESLFPIVDSSKSMIKYS